MTREQAKIVNAAIEALHNDEQFVLCVALETEGSSPRSAGTWMGVTANGQTVGTIGGGSLERIAVREAGDALKVGSSRCVQHLLSGAHSDTGMVCGGSITLCHHVLSASDSAALATLADLLETPQGGWMLLEDLDGAVRLDVCAHDGLPAAPAFLALACDPAPTLVAEEHVFVQSVRREEKIFVFGGGYIGQALAAVLARADFSVTVIDDRAGLVCEELFPEDVTVIQGDYGNIGESVSICPDDAVVIVTASHASDAAVAQQALLAGPAYLGCLGSTRKTRYLREKLTERGFSQADIDTLHMPIGLDIGAEGPEEIAISIAAELIAWRRKGWTPNNFIDATSSPLGVARSKSTD